MRRHKRIAHPLFDAVKLFVALLRARKLRPERFVILEQRRIVLDDLIEEVVDLRLIKAAEALPKFFRLNVLRCQHDASLPFP